MTAPALIVLYPGSLDQVRDQRAATTVRELGAQLAELRSDLKVEIASFDGGRTGLTTVATRLAAEGFNEAVLIPLHVIPTIQAQAELDSALDAVRRLDLGLSLQLAQPLGLDGYLLNILDERLRDALGLARVRELDALVLVAEGTADAHLNLSLERMARIWGGHHHLPTTLAFTDHTSPRAGEAVRSLRAQGKRHVAVAPLFIAQSRSYYQAFELAAEAGAITVSAPLGSHELLVDAILARYLVGALDLIPF